MKTQYIRRCTALLLASALLLSSCSSKLRATTMHLMRTEGQVKISDSADKDIQPVENLGLYSGYAVDTLPESYAWINLDKVKLNKLDQDSEIEIQKNGKHLEIIVNEGSLFFNVTEPLADDETLNIRTSSMLVGIRGTCGWVEVPKGETTMLVYLLEGEVRCDVESERRSLAERITDILEGKTQDKADGEGRSLSLIMMDILEDKTGSSHKIIRAGEMAVMTMEGEIMVSDFTVQDIPDFVAEELQEDKDLTEQIKEASGLDVPNPPGTVETQNSPETAAMQNPPEVAAALEQYRIIIRQADSYSYNLYSTPTGNYRYALVQMHISDTVPTLLLSQETTDFVDYVRVFQYDPDSGLVHQPTETLAEGTAAKGGFRGTLNMAGDGNGILLSEFSSGIGQMYISRTTLEGDSLHTVSEWEGTLEDTIPEHFRTKEIEWHDIEETDALNSWTASDI